MLVTSIIVVMLIFCLRQRAAYAMAGVLKHLAYIAPEALLPTLLEKVYPALEVSLLACSLAGLLACWLACLLF